MCSNSDGTIPIHKKCPGWRKQPIDVTVDMAVSVRGYRAK